MKKIIVAIILLTISCSIAEAHNHKEKYYQNIWCSEHNGKQEVVLDDGARVDCVTQNYAIEFDFASKWAESIGQSLYYGIKTNKAPAVVLIMENPKAEKRYLNRLNEVAKKYNIKVFTMSKDK